MGIHLHSTAILIRPCSYFQAIVNKISRNKTKICPRRLTAVEHQLHVFPRLALVACFPALRTGCRFFLAFLIGSLRLLCFIGQLRLRCVSFLQESFDIETSLRFMPFLFQWSNGRRSAKESGGKIQCGTRENQTETRYTICITRATAVEKYVQITVQVSFHFW